MLTNLIVNNINNNILLIRQETGTKSECSTSDKSLRKKIDKMFRRQTSKSVVSAIY